MARAELKASDKLTTRDRILESAQRGFSSASYEQVGLRNIAEDVGVDVAYVHRTFGSKEKLFTEVLRLSFALDRTAQASASDLVTKFTKDVFRPANTNNDSIDPLRIVVHSLSSATALSVQRQFILEEVIGPLAGQIDTDGEVRASMIAALLLGIRILRDVIELEALGCAHHNTLEALTTRMLEFCLGAVSE